MIEKLDTQFFVGTVHRWSTWIIIGVFYPARESQTSMLELLEQAAPGLSVKSSAGTGGVRKVEENIRAAIALMEALSVKGKPKNWTVCHI